MKAKKPIKLAGNMIMSFIIMSISAFGGMLFCVWYFGQNDTAVLGDTLPEPSSSANIITPTKQADNVPVGVSIQSISSPINQGDVVNITTRSNPGASCNITVTLNKQKYSDSSLVKKNTDEYGMVSWSWPTSSFTPSGKWSVEVLCSKGEKSGMVIGELVIK